MIAREPILDAQLSTNTDPFLDLYGHPGRRYGIDFTTNLWSPTWTQFDEVELLSPVTSLAAISPIGPMIFYRARQISLAGPLTIQRIGNTVIIEWPADCAGCVLQETSMMNANPTWAFSAAQPQLSGNRYRVTVLNPAGTRFYRLMRQSKPE